MMIWLILAAMTGAVALAVLWPLTRAWSAGATDADLAFYNAQLAEIDRDLARGLMKDADAEAARAEAARRLLRVRGDRYSPADHGEAALRRRRAASALAISMIPLVSLGIYGAFGSPNLPAQPLAARLATDPAQLSVTEAVTRIEAHLAANPDDSRGWELLAPVYLRVNRPADAARAFANVIRLSGETPDRLADYAEATILANDGIVSREAREIVGRSLTLDPDQAKARFLSAMTSEQDGDLAKAKASYESLAASAPADAPWLPLVRARLAALSQNPGEALSANVATADIRAMVQGLADRLAAGGGTVEEWARLVRSYAVLGEADRAREALTMARARFADDPAAVSRLSALADEFQLAGVKR